MSLHIDALRDIAANHGWSVCDEIADELEANAAEIGRLRKALEDIAYSGKTKTGMKEDARRALFGPSNAGLGGGPVQAAEARLQERRNHRQNREADR